MDDHPIVREGTRSLLERSDGIRVLGVAGSGAEALGLVERLRPQVLVLDLHLPDMSGLEVARRVRATAPGVAILVLTGHHSIGCARALVGLGVRGYLRKTASGEEVLGAIRALADGRTVLPADLAREASGKQAVQLTPREHEVLRLLATGRSNADISAALTVSINTAEFHLRSLLAKFGARSRTEVVAKAREQGLLLDPPGDVGA